MLGASSRVAPDMATIEKRQTPAGAIHFRVKVRLRGHKARTETFHRLTDAKQWAQHTEADLRRQRQFKCPEAERHTLSEAIDRYVEGNLTRLRSRRLIGAQLKWWRVQIGHMRLSDLTAAEIVRQRDALSANPKNRAGKIAPPTLNRYVAALSIVLTTASREWGWLEQVPTARVKGLKEPRGRTRTLDDTERRALLEACQQSLNTRLHAIVVLALSTGARKMELLNLRWADVDVERKRLVFRETKNGEQRGVPLTAPACAVLASLARGEPQKLLFPSPRRTDQPVALQCVWEKALTTAGIRDFRFHDLRHTAASYLAMSGATTSDIAAILGHKSLAMVQRYQHLTESHAGAVAERMASKFLTAEKATPDPETRIGDTLGIDAGPGPR